MTVARPSVSLADAQPPFFVGVDLSGAEAVVGLVDDQGRLIARLTAPVDHDRGPEQAVAQISAAVANVIATAGAPAADIRGLGLGLPGAIDLAAGTLLSPARFPGWEGFALRDRLSNACKLPVTLANTADAAAYGEFWVGAGRKYHSLVLFTLGPEIGTGIVLGDLVLLGQYSQTSEGGHMIIDCTATARPCTCGQRGHLDAYIDAAAPPERVEETARFLAVGIVNILHTVDPDAVLLGGPMNFGGAESPLGRRFLAAIKDDVRRLAFTLLAERTAIEFATLDAYAALLGAAGLARFSLTVV